jgi:hypothetical protein
LPTIWSTTRSGPVDYTGHSIAPSAAVVLVVAQSKDTTIADILAATRSMSCGYAVTATGKHTLGNEQAPANQAAIGTDTTHDCRREGAAAFDNEADRPQPNSGEAL